jgi:hypothetical protein
VAVLERDLDRDHEIGCHEQLGRRGERPGGAVALARPAFQLALNAVLRRAHELGLASQQGLENRARLVHAQPDPDR